MQLLPPASPDMFCGRKCSFARWPLLEAAIFVDGACQRFDARSPFLVATTALHPFRELAPCGRLA